MDQLKYKQTQRERGVGAAWRSGGGGDPHRPRSSAGFRACCARRRPPLFRLPRELRTARSQRCPGPGGTKSGPDALFVCCPRGPTPSASPRVQRQQFGMDGRMGGWGIKATRNSQRMEGQPHVPTTHPVMGRDRTEPMGTGVCLCCVCFPPPPPPHHRLGN